MLTATNYKYRNFTTSKVACFISVDPLQFKYPIYTPYQYAGNNPVTFNDLDGAETTDNQITEVPINGPQSGIWTTEYGATKIDNHVSAEFRSVSKHSVWEITNEWDDEYIHEFGLFVQQKAEKWSRLGEKYTCEDFALALVIEFSKDNNLPFYFENNTKSFNANEYTGDYETFYNDILTTSGARDLTKNINSTEITISEATPGSFQALYRDENHASHIQVVTENGDDWISGIQGGTSWFPPTLSIQGIKDLWNEEYKKRSSNPGESDIYIGKELRTFFYDKRTDLYWNDSSFTFDFSKSQTPKIYKFNFLNWNKYASK